jgi:hypothetical protein
MPLVPNRFLVRLLYACPYVKDMPRDDEESLIALPDAARLDSFADMDAAPNFGDVRLGWNETGLGLTVDVKGKDNLPIGDVGRPRQSDGVTIWIDTRGDRTRHRATRTCHQFHFLAAGGGPNKDEPAFAQSKIHRALQDAPLAGTDDVPFRYERKKGGYRIEAFLSASVLSGFDPEQYPRLGVFYAVRDFEKGEQTPGADSDFPFAEDPSLWASLELVKGK